jgi:hypothetical protein
MMKMMLIMLLMLMLMEVTMVCIKEGEKEWQTNPFVHSGHKPWISRTN